MQLHEIENKFQEDIKTALTPEDVERVSVRYLGRKGILTQVLREIKNLSPRERKKKGSDANALKTAFLKMLEKKRIGISHKKDFSGQEKEWIDISAPGVSLPKGHLHPLSRIRREIAEIFTSLGFLIVDGPEVETEYNNFDALNMPKDHPAREMHDTFWLDEKDTGGVPMLLRTHTSTVQIRFMKKYTPPFRIISMGRCYRYEATDASHDIQFHQVEGLMAGKDISVANLKAIFKIFYQRMFSKDVSVRLVPSYFPFVEPGFEVYMNCLVCSGKGCTVCQGTGWLEMMGAGMVHPNVFKNVGYLPGEWQGFAFGGGYDRLAMMKYNISDIRQFHSGDLRFLSRV